MALWPWGRHSLLTEVSTMDPVKYCWAISRVQFSDDRDDRDASRNVGLLAIQTRDAAGARE